MQGTGVGDIIKVKKVNQRSIIIEYSKLSSYKFDKRKVGDTKKINYDTFGDFILNCTDFGKDFYRSYALESLLNEN